MSNIRKVMVLGQAIRRQMSSNPNVTDVPSKKFARLKELQARFGVDDGVPSYLKGGLMDRILFGITVALTTVGLVMSADVLYQLAVPKKE